jgi:hypothetical protein
MRVLHIDTGKAMRGGQYQLLLLYDTLAERNMDQALLAGPAISSRRDVERTNWRTLRRHARECDVLHAHDARAHTLAVMHGAGRPVVVARRVAFPIRTGIASRWKYRRAAHFVAISNCVASVLESGGVPAEKITVVRDAGPSVTALSEGPEAVRARGTVCRDGFRVVSPNFDDPLKCRELAVAACKRAGIPILLSDDLPRDLRSADALLYLSKSEGLGSALLLAMSLGVPVIASAVGGMPEVVTNGATGLLVENDIEDVSCAVTRLQRDRDLRQRMADAALTRVRTDFTRERMADLTVQVYSRMLGVAQCKSP